MTTPSGRQSSAGYTLRVAGRLDARWANWFDGFTVTGEADGTTTLSGTVADQAQLHRLFAKIRDLGVALVSVETSAPINGGEPFPRLSIGPSGLGVARAAEGVDAVGGEA